jgi:hypothetical protein
VATSGRLLRRLAVGALRQAESELSVEGIEKVQHTTIPLMS